MINYIRKIYTIAILISSVTITGCASIQESVGLSPMAMSATSVDSVTQKAKSGEIIYEQTASIIAGARLSADFKQATGVPGLGTTYATKKGKLFYKLMTSYGPAYCSYEAGGTADLGLTELRLCFRDTDDNGKFDEIWTMDETGFVAGPSSGYLLRVAKVKGEVSYVALEENALPKQRFGILYQTPLLAKPKLSVVHLTAKKNGKDTVALASSDSVSVPKSENLPTTLDVDGAKIEILALDGKQIKYRILSGFPDDTMMTVIRQRMPVYVYY